MFCILFSHPLQNNNIIYKYIIIFFLKKVNTNFFKKYADSKNELSN